MACCQKVKPAECAGLEKVPAATTRWCENLQSSDSGTFRFMGQGPTRCDILSSPHEAALADSNPSMAAHLRLLEISASSASSADCKRDGNHPANQRFGHTSNSKVAASSPALLSVGQTWPLSCIASCRQHACWTRPQVLTTRPASAWLTQA